MKNLQNYFKDFLYHCEFNENKSLNTIKSLKKDILQLLKYLTEVEKIEDPNDISQTELKSYLIQLKNEEIAFRTLNRKISSIKSFFRYLKDKKGLKYDPSIFLETSQFENKIPDILSKEELNRLRDVIDLRTINGVRDRLIVEILYSSGITPNELLHLGMVNFNLEAREIIVMNNKVSRKVFFSNTALKYLTEYVRVKKIKFKEQYNENILFTNNSAKRLSDRSLRRIISKYGELAKIEKDLSPYTFRHSFSTYMLLNGMKKNNLKIILGIKNNDILDVYEEILKKESLWA